MQTEEAQAWHSSHHIWRRACRLAICTALVAISTWLSAAPAAAQMLSIQGDRFAVNGQQRFLVFITYFDALDVPDGQLDADLGNLHDAVHIDGIRIFQNNFGAHHSPRPATSSSSAGTGTTASRRSTSRPARPSSSTRTGTTRVRSSSSPATSSTFATSAPTTGSAPSRSASPWPVPATPSARASRGRRARDLPAVRRRAARARALVVPQIASRRAPSTLHRRAPDIA
jgi:hypothetical protein